VALKFCSGTLGSLANVPSLRSDALLEGLTALAAAALPDHLLPELVDEVVPANRAAGTTKKLP